MYQVFNIIISLAIRQCAAWSSTFDHSYLSRKKKKPRKQNETQHAPSLPPFSANFRLYYITIYRLAHPTMLQHELSRCDQSKHPWKKKSPYTYAGNLRIHQLHSVLGKKTKEQKEKNSPEHKAKHSSIIRHIKTNHLTHMKTTTTNHPSIPSSKKRPFRSWTCLLGLQSVPFWGQTTVIILRNLFVFPSGTAVTITGDHS